MNTMKLSLFALLIGICLPTNLSFNIGTLLITPLRLLSFFLFLSFLRDFLLNLTVKKTLFFDLMIIGHVLWAFLSMFVNHDIFTGIEAGGLYFVDFFPFYMMGRGIGKDVEYTRKLLKYILYACVILIPFAWIESIFSINLLKTIFGLPTDIFEQRIGLNRAYASFSHPILYGLFISGFLGLLFYMNIKNRGKITLLLCIGTIPALSSAPLLSLMFQLFLIAWDKTFRQIKAKWKILIATAAFLFIFLNVVTNSGPIKLAIKFLTFNSGTGYYRLEIWNYGLDNIYLNPYFGIGYHDWIRASWMVITSVDSFWLFTTMKYGIPSIVFLIAFLIALYFTKLSKIQQKNDIVIGWKISMAAYIFVGFTVHFWNSSLSIFALLLGIGLSTFKNADLK